MRATRLQHERANRNAVDCTGAAARTLPAMALTPLDKRVHAAHGDAWQAEGRLRAPFGGGAVELPGVRLMASGLPYPQWNNGDVDDPAHVSVDRARTWYAQRAGGAGVPWGVHLPEGTSFAHGRHLFRKRCMALLPARFAPPAAARSVRVRAATCTDAETVARIDAAAFDMPVGEVFPWIEPHFGAAGFTVALADVDGEPVGIGTAIVTAEWAGPSVGLFGVGVLESARRRGVASAVTSWLLERGFSAGATLAHLNPDSDVAADLYRRLGFEETAGLDVYGEL